MFTVRVHPSQINDRINAEANSPELIENFDLIQSSGFEIKTLGKLVDAPINNSIRNVTEEFQNLNGTIPMFRPADMNGFWLDSDTAPKISRAFEEKHRKARVYPGDIVLAAAGTVGQAARVPPHVEFGNINGSCARISPSQGLDGYLLAYLNSRIGYLALMRLVVGSVQKHLNLEDLPGLLVPLPNKTVQTYIGDKVRQAERLRERSRTLQHQVTITHLKLIPSQASVDFRQRSRHVPCVDLTERLDAHFYPPAVEKYLQSLDSIPERLSRLTKGIFNGQTYTVSETSLGGWQATVANLSSSFLQRPYRWVDTPKFSDRYLQPHDLLLCNAAHTKSYIGQDITYFQGGIEIIPSTEVMVIRVDRNKVPASYIRTYLLTQIGYLQLQSTIRGITAHSYPGDVSLLRIPIPEVLFEEREQWFETDNLMLTAGSCQDYAERLTTAAKLLVEALIEGNMTELELQEAQEALQQGDTTLDRQILSRLTRKGIPARGERTEEPPLFPDLDALYRVLSDDDDTDEDSDWDSTPESRQRWQTPIQSSRRAAEASTPYSQDATVTLLDEEGN